MTEQDYDLRKKEIDNKNVLDRERLVMDKIDLLENLLTASKPDASGAFRGSDTVYVPVLSQENAEIVEEQIMKLIKKIC